MSLFHYSTDDVINAVDNAIKNFDSTVSSVTNLLTFNLKEGIWREMWTSTDRISTAISVVAVCMAVIYAYTAIVKQGLTLKGDFKKIITIILRLCIAKGMIDYATSFMFWIYSFGAKITSIVSTKASKISQPQTLINLFNKDEFLAGLGLNSSSSSWDCFLGYIQTKFFFGIFFWGLGIALMIIAIARILKIYIMAMFSCIAFAKLPLYGYDGIKEYVSSILALSLQGAIMIGAITLYKFCIFRAGDIGRFYTDSMFGTFGIITILSISLVLIIAKSETIAKKIV